LGVANQLFNFNAEDNATLDGTNYSEVLGLFDCSGTINSEDELGSLSLADMNDNEEKTFVQIADFIEQNPELVFTHSV
jgi:hypothetical protein